MPLMRCTLNGKKGWKWGKNGKCYTGSDAKAKATKQSVAIRASGFKENTKKKKRKKKGLY